MSSLFNILQKAYINIRESEIRKQLGGGNRSVGWPFLISGAENLHFDENVSIGPGATIYSTRAKLIIKKHVVVGPNFTVITGDHMHIIGRYVDTVTDAEKLREYDQDVIIESDVWIGCNVTILKGVTIGRGSVVAAGAVVTKSCVPYSIVGGIPAKVIGKVFSDDDIIKHEMLLKNSTC